MSDILPVCQWDTIASKIPAQKKGKLSVVKRPVEEGTVLEMAGVLGYQECLFTCPDNKITVLYEGDSDPKSDPDGVWMSDSPYEYYGMAQLAARAKSGDTLVGGLGLGILANLLAAREDIDSVTVIEKNPDVVEMVKPYLHDKVKVTQGDFFMEMAKLEMQKKDFSTVISDIYKDCQSKEDEELYEDCQISMTDAFPDAEHLHWCFQENLEDDIIRFYLRYKAITEEKK